MGQCSDCALPLPQVCCTPSSGTAALRPPTQHPCRITSTSLCWPSSLTMAASSSRATGTPCPTHPHPPTAPMSARCGGACTSHSHQHPKGATITRRHGHRRTAQTLARWTSVRAHLYPSTGLTTRLAWGVSPAAVHRPRYIGHSSLFPTWTTLLIHTRVAPHQARKASGRHPRLVWHLGQVMQQRRHLMNSVQIRRYDELHHRMVSKG